MVMFSASDSSGSATAATVLEKERVPLMVPTIPLEGIETLVTGFRATVLDTEHGHLSTHGGFGSRFAVSMEWKGRHVVIDGIDLLAAWVETFAPEDAEGIRAASITVPSIEQWQRGEDVDDDDSEEDEDDA